MERLPGTLGQYIYHHANDTGACFKSSCVSLAIDCGMFSLEMALRDPHASARMRVPRQKRSSC